MCLLRKMMVYIRKKKLKGRNYYYIVKGVYEKGKKKKSPKQKVIKYIGTIENILKKFEFWEENH